MKDIIIGIDAGTSVIKSVAFSLDGEQLAECSTPNTYATLGGGGVEQDLPLTWKKTIETLAGLVDKLPELTSRCAAISVTGQGDGTWLVDKHGEPVGGGLLWLDSRAGDLVDKWRASQHERRRFEITGTGFAACQQASQLLWMKTHSPERIAQAHTAFHCKDWLYFQLTGQRVTDTSEGCFTFGDYRTRQYSSELLDLLDLNDCESLLPPMLNGMEENHPLNENAAALTGLLSGTPVVMGFLDVICTGLGAGLYDKHSSTGCTIVGSTGIHMRLVHSADAVSLNEHCTGFTIALPMADTFAQVQSNMSCTLNIDWLLDVAVDLLQSHGVKKSRSDLLASVDEWVAQSTRRGELLYQPYISDAGERGPFIDVSARAGFVGLNSQHRFGDMMSAVVDGLALAARDCYTAMGGTPAEIRLTGGAARSQSLRQVFANTLGAKLRTCAREEAGAAGAAMMAAVGIGHYADMDDCVKTWVTPHLSELEDFDVAEKQHMDVVFSNYVSTRTALSDLWKSQSRLRHL
ncbi:MAG: FGGY family carbohydrate kinase [Granulosicoccus sp.]